MKNGNLNVLCACDLLNEGWDSPHYAGAAHGAPYNVKNDIYAAAWAGHS